LKGLKHDNEKSSTWGRSTGLETIKAGQWNGFNMG
jgi:hypothetical protein